ncbi:MAG: tetratricopeptide repeat protein [Bacteroidaceae bacterium]|nr:tetratricopeptide repeat protein [Bacteroidaceae bacterium]
MTATRFSKGLLTFFIMLLAAVSAAAGDVEKALEAFDKQANAATANAFFGELLKAEFIDEMEDFRTDTPTDSLQQQVWYWAAEWMYDQQQYELAESYALKALPKYHPANPEKADCLNTLGCIYVRLSDFKQAANYAKQSVEIEMRGGDHDRISSSLNTLAGIYMAGYQAKEAEDIILQALDHANQVDNPGRKAIILGMASEIYHSLGNDEKALPYAEEAIKIEEQLGRTQKLPIRLSQKASALLGLHRYEEAEAIYRQIAPELKQMGDYHSYAIALNRLGMSLLCQERQQEAIPYYKEAADLFSRMGDLYNEIHSHRGLYESYWKLNPDSAKLELDLFDLLKDSLYTHSTAEALSRYNAEFGNDQLQKENAEVRQAHRRTIILGTALILLIAAAAWFVIRRSHRRWQKQMQEMVKEVERLQTLAKSLAHSNIQSSLPPEDEQEDSRFLIRVIEAVNAAMPQGNFGVEQIASELNMSVQTFRRRLQNAAGEPPKTFIQAIQMERAVMLLTDNPNMTVSQIANLCGFDEASSFGHTFKRIYGCSPSEFRDMR